MSFSKSLFAIALAFCLAAPAKAEEPTTPPLQEHWSKLEAAKQFLTMLEYLVMAIPQYQAPEVLENGDIIIRRNRPEEDQPSQKKNSPPAQRKI